MLWTCSFWADIKSCSKNVKTGLFFPASRVEQAYSIIFKIKLAQYTQQLRPLHC
jgi:hypothetical protein